MTKAARREQRVREAVKRDRLFNLYVMLSSVIDQWKSGIKGGDANYQPIDIGDMDKKVIQDYLEMLSSLCLVFFASIGKEPDFTLRANEFELINKKVAFLNSILNGMFPELSYSNKLFIETNTIHLCMWDLYCTVPEIRSEVLTMHKIFREFCEYVIKEGSRLDYPSHAHYMACSPTMYEFPIS